jgi:GNAT superfamily N-acetyltransferase
MAMASRDPVEIGVAVPADGPRIVDILTEGAAWMAAKDCPAWSAAVLTEAYVAPRIARSEFLAARVGGEIAGVCTLSRTDPVFWPDDPPGFAAYLHKLAVRRAFAGGSVTRALIAHCAELAGRWSCSALRLDCHPVLRPLYERHGFSYVDTRGVREDDDLLVVDRLELLLGAENPG